MDKLKLKASSLPFLPGVYLMLNTEDEVIYVGKAKNLKNRVSSYFIGEPGGKLALMLRNVDDFEYIVAASEFEALVLENALIKQYQPRYNILLKDDKSYPYIRINFNDEYPKLSMSNKKLKDKAEYFGPYASRGKTISIIDTLNKAFGLPSCSRKFPRDLGKGRPCLNKDIGKCEAWCTGELSKELYNEAIANIKMILGGKVETLKGILEEKMLAEAEALDFESAAKTRDRLKSVAEIMNKQNVIATSFSDTDAIGFSRSKKSAFVILKYKDGNLQSKKKYLFAEPFEEDAVILSNLILSYYLDGVNIPKEILIPFPIEDAEVLEKVLSDKSKFKVKIIAPQRGKKRKLVESAVKNANEESEAAERSELKIKKVLLSLKEILSLDTEPITIEAFDVSNLGDEGIVAGMTVFVNGRPIKNRYRRFRIQSIDRQNDIASMEEAVLRRFKKYIDGDSKFSELPDLILIDGGLAQLNAVKRALDALEISAPSFGMLKDSNHRTSELVNADGERVGITANLAVYNLISQIQEETHDYTINYQKKLRKEKIKSELLDIEGIGQKRYEKIIETFGSIRNASKAPLGELESILPKKIALKLYKYFRNGA